MIEWSVLLSAFISLFMLAYLHVIFIRSPISCLKSAERDWPKDGVLRIEIISDPASHESYHLQQQSPEADGTAGDGHTLVVDSVIGSLDEESSLNSSIASLMKISEQHALPDNGYPAPLRDKISHLEMFTRSGTCVVYFLVSCFLCLTVWPNDNYIVEYSLEYGFLRLSAKTRQRLKIPVKVVTLDPAKDDCFGDQFSRLLLRSFLGYDDVLMGSLKSLAEKQNNKGFVRNVVTGEHYRFVNIWSVSYMTFVRQLKADFVSCFMTVDRMTRSAYIAALFIMLVFTLSISMLLRYSHHQVFVFVGQSSCM